MQWRNGPQTDRWVLTRLYTDRGSFTATLVEVGDSVDWLVDIYAARSGVAAQVASGVLRSGNNRIKQFNS